MPVGTTSPVVGPPEWPPGLRQNLVFESRLKIYRARRHAHELSVTWQQVCESHSEVISVEQDPGNGMYGVGIRIPIPATIPLCIGDCIRCLRSALDYLIAGLARRAGLPDDHVIFPFNEKRKVIEQSFSPETAQAGQKRGKRAGALHSVSLKYPDLQDIILERVRPYSADDGGSPLGDLIWRLVTMDNIDKHRLITPTVSVGNIPGVMIGGMLVLSDVVMSGGRGIGFSQKPEIQYHGDPTIDIVFPSATRVADEPVLITLMKGCDAVSSVIDIFEAHFVRE